MLINSANNVLVIHILQEELQLVWIVLANIVQTVQITGNSVLNVLQIMDVVNLEFAHNVLQINILLEHNHV